MKPSLIFDIKRYAINDGPGIRITIFLKGCLLSCPWCHNPESISREVQKLYSESKCIGSQECVKNCTKDALTLTPDGIVTNVDLCNLCGDCAEVCPTKAIEMSGELMSVDQVMQFIKKETLLMDQSDGGVTFSGGEPLLHHKFLIQLLDACGEEGIHRCIDTTGFASKQVVLEVAKRTEHFLYDLKMMDSERHKKYTGVPNEKILENLIALSSLGKDINIRIPLIHGVNDDDENIKQSAAFIAALPGEVKMVNILPYHNIASKKYEKLGGTYDEGSMGEPEPSRQEEILDTFKSYGLEAIVGGNVICDSCTCIAGHSLIEMAFIGNESMKTHSTNYRNTFIEIAEDCLVDSGQILPIKGDKMSVANYQFEMIMENPYKYTSDDVFFIVYATRKGIHKSNWREARMEFFSKGQPCFRASPLTKRYGWGIHSDENGKVAMYGAESEEYRRFVSHDNSVRKVKAMKLKR